MPKRKSRRLRGGQIHGLRPDWQPLLAFAPDEIPEFMWMFRVDLEDGTVVEAYKHSWTRQYVYLDSARRAYVFRGGGIYEEADPRSQLEEALADRESRGNIVRQNDWYDGERIGWARSATRHRVRREQTLWVIQHAGICFENGTGREGEPLLYFFGDDEDGCPLEVAATKGSMGELTVIHSMHLRDQFEDEYMEALRWRK